MASRLGRRVEISYRKGVKSMKICDLLLIVIKLLPDIIKLAMLIAKAIKSKRRPPNKV